MVVTLAEFFVATDPGIPASEALTVLGPDHLYRVMWPGTICEPGWWWAITEIDGTVIAAAWTLGSQRDALNEIGRSLARLRRVLGRSGGA